MRRPATLIAFAALVTAACQGVLPAPPEEVRSKDRLAAYYVHAPYDKEQHQATCKVWHEIYSPDGRLLTKGLGGKYQHHRGLFFGHNVVRRGDETFDFWHCRNGVSQRHVGFVGPAALQGLNGPWQVVSIDWASANGEPVVHELRALRAFGDAPRSDPH